MTIWCAPFNPPTTTRVGTLSFTSAAVRGDAKDGVENEFADLQVASLDVLGALVRQVVARDVDDALVVDVHVRRAVGR